VDLQKDTRPSSDRRSRISLAASMTRPKPTSGAGSRSKTRRPGRAGSPGWLFQGCSSTRALRYGGQTFDPINLHIRFSVAGHRDSSRRRLDPPFIECLWKKRCPPMPSGAPMIEHGRPWRCPIIHLPTSSKYRGPASLTAPSPSSGHRTLSGRLRVTPIKTSSLEAADERLARVVVLAGTGLAMSVLPEGAGRSASTSLAGLS
jgi:hypothetical protein